MTSTKTVPNKVKRKRRVTIEPFIKKSILNKARKAVKAFNDSKSSNKKQAMTFNNNVFLNCPFDDDYKSMFDSIVFTIKYCGFDVRCAREEEDSGVIRIEKILKIISNCKYGIHDISRAELDPNTKLARFNMPLELGIFIGAKKFHNIKSKRKYLILDISPFRYRDFISDIAGSDIKAHNKEPRKAVLAIRDWLDSKTRRNIPASSKIWERFETFTTELPYYSEQKNWDEKELSYQNYLALVIAWIEKNPTY